MLRLALVLGTLFGVIASAHADSVVLGRGITNEFAALLQCPPDQVCLDSLYAWEFRARRTIIGERIAGRVRALTPQHVDATPEFVRSVRLFVVRPIEDPRVREAYGAEFYLVALSPSYDDSTYCLPESPATYGLDISDDEVTVDSQSRYHCFPSALIE